MDGHAVAFDAGNAAVRRDTCAQQCLQLLRPGLTRGRTPDQPLKRIAGFALLREYLADLAVRLPGACSHGVKSTSFGLTS